MANGEQQWATGVLRELGKKPTQRSVSNLIGWAKAEGGHTNGARYNWLNTTQNMPGAGNTGTQGNIKVYRSLQQGIDATAKTLKNGRYGAILRSLDGSPQQLAQAIDSSPWGTHNPQLAQIIASGKGHPAYGSSTAPSSSPAPSTTAPQAAAPVDDSSRQQALLGYLEQRGDPNALLSLASALSLNQQPAQAAPTTKRTMRKSGPSTLLVGRHASSPKGLATFEGTKVAAWIAPALQYARQHGWKGKVNSGYRSYADQTRIYNSGVRPAAKPGTSNHEGADYPRGAVDVSDAQQLSSILQQSPYAHKLVYAGAKDPVHFSHPHNGSY